MKGAKRNSIDVSHIAKLAKLPLKKSEEGKFTRQLSHVLDYFEKVSEINTQGVKGEGQVTIENNRFREDEVQRDRMLTQKEALGQAKRTHKGFFVVDAVLDKA